MMKISSKRIVSTIVLAAMTVGIVGCGNAKGGANMGIGKNKNYDKDIVFSIENKSKTNNGVFEGWGTALCWWANRIGYSDKLSEDAANLFYGEDGLRFNIIRYNIGGGDDPTHNHITRTDSAVPGWLYINPETGEKEYNYEADKNQLNVLKRCYDKAGKSVYVETFSNSAPYFMTISGCSSGGEDASKNNLKDDCYEEFAEYMAHVDKYINDELNIHVNSISPMNEPFTNYWSAYSWKQEGCHFDQGESQSKMIVATKNAFDAVGLNDVEVVASDETSTMYAATSYKAYSDEAKKAVSRVSTHTYDTTGIKSLKALRESEGFNLWMSEVDGGNGVKGAGEMGSGLYIANKIITDLNGLEPSAWVMWQVIDNHVSSEGYNGNKDSGMPNVLDGFWGAAVANHDREVIVLTQKYYAIGQFTRYIKPGTTLIHTDNDHAIGAIDEENRTLTIVCENMNGEEKLYHFGFEGLDIKSGKCELIRTSGSMNEGEHWDSVDNFDVKKDGFSYMIKPYSVNTFIISY